MPTPDTNNETGMDGGLYVVATPIGNMDDITVRAINVLARVDLIAAEDTRHTGKLLARHGIKRPLISYHEHNENERSQELVERLKQGDSIALVTDAGTPSVSDPGYRLVRQAAEGEIPVIPVPGASAAMAALSVSGLPTDAFSFIGFPDRKKGRRLKMIQSLALETKTLIFYESPKRVIRLLGEIRHIMGNRRAVLARELTKLHEEICRGNISDLIACLEKKTVVKGECTLVISGAEDPEPLSEEALRDEIGKAFEIPGMTPSAATQKIVARFGLPRNRVYKEVLKLKRK